MMSQSDMRKNLTSIENCIFIDPKQEYIRKKETNDGIYIGIEENSNQNVFLENININKDENVVIFAKPGKGITFNFNPILVATKDAKSVEEKEHALRKFLEQTKEYAPAYALQRLSDMSFLDAEPEWKEKATIILKEYAELH